MRGAVGLCQVVLVGVVLASVGFGCEKKSVTTNDEASRQRLLRRVGDLDDLAHPRALVTLEEFFEGNLEAGSIGYNLREQVRPEEFFRLLRTMRDRPDVGDVRIEVKDMEDPSDWPATDTIWVITSAGPNEVAAWFPERLAPDELSVGFPDGSDETHLPVEPYAVPNGMRAVAAFYD